MKNIANIYNSIAENYNKRFSKPSDYMEKFLKLLPKNGEILDAGCGTGTDLNLALSKKFLPTGVDLSKEMLKIAKNHYPTIDFRLGDIRELQLRNHKFDGIIASYSLIHIPKKEIPKILRNFYKLLKKKGLIYLSLQLGKSEEIFMSEPFKQNKKLFFNIISLIEIKKLLEENNFKIIYQYKKKAKKNQLQFSKLFIFAQKM